MLGMSPDAAAIHARRWWTLSVLCLSLLIIFVGNTTLNVAIPDLSRDLNATTSELQWVVAAYSLVFAGLLFSTGAMGDRFGRKGVLQLGLVGFLASSLLAAASHDMTQLIVCRALMGASAALIMPATLSILVNIFPAGERAKAIAIWAATAGAAGVIGPVGSGWLLGHFWYGSVFLVNVPIVILALVGGHYLVPKSRDPEQGRLDPVGAVLSIIGISTLVFGLIEAPDVGWTSTEALAAFGIAIVTLVLFVAWELHVEVPMLDMHFFRNPAFSTGTGGMILVFLAMSGVMFLTMQYFQLVLGYSPLSAAIRFLPMAPIMVLVSTQTPAPQRPVRHQARRRRGHAARRHRPVHVPRPRDRHAVHLRARLHHPARRRHGAGHVADDGRDHVGGAGPSRRCGVGHERRHARARVGARCRRARQHRGVPLRECARPARRPSCRPARRPPPALHCRARCRRPRSSPPPRAARSRSAPTRRSSVASTSR